MPVRNIPIQNRSVAGYFYSHKNKKTIAFESQLEKKCYIMLEFDKTVRSYEEQPIKIDLYVPDILVDKIDNSKLLIEVKYSKEIQETNQKLEHKFKTVRSFCKEKKWEFKIFTEKDIKQPYFDNISFLYRYIKIPVADEHKIFNFILEKIKTNIKLLIENDFDIREIYSLLAQGKLDANLFKELTLSSNIKVCNE